MVDFDMLSPEPPLWVSFFTDDYERAAQRLVRSLKDHDLPHEVLRVPDEGTWQGNCARKAKFVWDRMAKHPGRAIIWTDADSVVKASPVLLVGKPKADVMLCRWKRPEGRVETLSGTVYFSGSAGSVRVVDRWVEACANHPGIWDQRCLEIAVESLTGVSVELLPVEYCFIHDTFRVVYPDRVPVIEHFQASRLMRGKRVDVRT